MKQSGLVTALVCAGVILSAGAASAFDDPRALAAAIYEPYAADSMPVTGSEIFSANLTQLIADYTAANADNEMGGGLDFDFFMSGQDYDVTDLQVGKAIELGARASVTVSYYNFGQPNFSMLSLVNEGGEWLVDDVAHFTPDYDWLVSTALYARP